ncbi:hypothetical protein BSKO_09930 [Bryopsis sp. KO-2023]|nr:hypothetical protein BSKO_09930 [Bryopsis sp. KO-2023]
MENYEKGPVLGEGTFGKVVKAIHKETGKVVAIKKVRTGDNREGINMTALREIKLQRELKSDKVVELLDVFEHKNNLSLVFEFMESDMEAVIRDQTIILSAADIKSYVKMTLETLAYVHDKFVLHRDVKPNNLLIAATGEIKLADFGLARIFCDPDPRFTPQVFSRWYRPPELLFGTTAYGPYVDVWAAGCVFAELMLRAPWFPGDTDIDQLGKIFQCMGTPNMNEWPDHIHLPHYVEYKATPPIPLNQIFRKASTDALDLLSKMMKLNPNQRPTAKEALEHAYFKNDPKPTKPSSLPRPKKREDAPLVLAPQPAMAEAKAC